MYSLYKDILMYSLYKLCSGMELLRGSVFLSIRANLFGLRQGERGREENMNENYKLGERFRRPPKIFLEGGQVDKSAPSDLSLVERTIFQVR